MQDEINIDKFNETLVDVIKKAHKLPIQANKKKLRNHRRHKNSMQKKREMKANHTTNIVELRNLDKNNSKSVRKNIINFNTKEISNTIK